MAGKGIDMPDFFAQTVMNNGQEDDLKLFIPKVVSFQQPVLDADKLGVNVGV